MNFQNLDASFDAWSRSTAMLVGISRNGAIILGQSYLRMLGLREGQVSAMNVEQFMVAMHVTGVAAVKRALSQGQTPDLAMIIGRSLSYGAATRLVLNAQRGVIMRSAVQDEDVAGWRRVGKGGCKFCSMLIGRGAVYNQDTSSFLSHDRCRCSAEPALDDSPPFVPETGALNPATGEGARQA